MKKTAQRLSFALLALFLVYGPVQAQPAAPQNNEKKKIFESKARAIDAVILRVGGNNVQLWGIENIEGGSARFRFEARQSLDNLIGDDNVTCEMISRRGDLILARCANSSGLDLSLSMLQKGYALVDRSTVYGSIFEEPYIGSELQAYNIGLGIWNDARDNADATPSGVNSGGIMALLLVALLFLVAALGAVSFVMMRGFKNLVASQDRNTKFLSRERQLKNKERGIVASMLESELKVNKSKIEAYLTINEEMLKTLSDQTQTPKYKKSGDMVQLQPSLDRVIFDGNTDKLDLLGRGLSTAVVHFYARIKTNPDFVILEPGMPAEEAIGHVKKAVDNARRLNEILEKIIPAFSQNGISKSETDAKKAA